MSTECPPPFAACGLESGGKALDSRAMRRAILLLLVLLSACIPQPDRPAPRPSAPRQSPAPPTQSTQQCLADLEREGVAFKLLPDRVFDNGCSALGSVQLLDIGTPTTNLGAMTCPLARTFARWAREAVQPAAQQWFGMKVTKIESFGTYSCRPVNGQDGNKLSEHGRANAVDIGAFVLADGRRITVLDGWPSRDPKVRGFLQTVHDAGCRRFGITLGPDANEFHRNHFHFDMGRGPYCR
jgi:hypothetical protein